MVRINYDVGSCSRGQFNAGKITDVFTTVEIVTKGVFVRMDTILDETYYGAVAMTLSREELDELIPKLISIRDRYDELTIAGAIR